MAVAILSACLVTFKPLWHMVSSWTKNLKHSFRSIVKPLHQAYRSSKFSRGSSKGADSSLEPQTQGSWHKMQDKGARRPGAMLPSLGTMHHTIDISYASNSVNRE
jgi:hypothetical protein